MTRRDLAQGDDGEGRPGDGDDIPAEMKVLQGWASQGQPSQPSTIN